MKNYIKKLLSVLVAMALLITGILPGTVYAEGMTEQTTYQVKIDQMEHGKIETEKEAYKPGEKVVLKVVPDENYVLKSLEVTAPEGERIDLTEEYGTYYFQMPDSDVRIIGKVALQEPEIVKETETSETKTIDETAQVEETESEDKTAVKSFLAPTTRSAIDYVDYRAIKQSGSSATAGATVISSTTEIPDDYTGFIKGGTCILNCAYDSQVTWSSDGTTHDYVLLKDAYKEGGSQAGYVSALYPKVCYYDGQWVDIKVTVIDWKVNSNYGDKAYWYFREYPGGHLWGAEWAELKHEFFLHGTNTPVTVKGYSTWKDIDWQQGVVLKEGFTGQVYIDPGASALHYTTVNGYKYFYDPVFAGVENDNVAHWITALFNASKFTTVYTFIDENGWGNGEIIVESDKLLKGPVSISKKVSDNDETLVTSNTLSQEPEPRKEKFDYTILVSVPGESSSTYYDALIVRDKIDTGLIVNKEKITIKDESGNDVTSKFDTGLDTSNLLTVSAKSSALSSESFYTHVYAINVPVNIKDTTNLKSEQYWDSAKDMAKINNTATLICDAINDGEMDSNEVTTYVPLDSVPDNSLKVVKTEDGTGIPLPGVTFKVYEWNGSSYDTVAYDTLSDSRMAGTYLNTIPYPYTSTNQGKFKVVEIQSAEDHFNAGWSTEITYDGTAAVTLTYDITNVKIEPKLSVTKSFDFDWYDFNDEVKTTLTVRNYGNIDVTNLTLSEDPSQALKAVLVGGTGSYVVPAGGVITTENGERITVTVDANDSNKLYISELKMGDSFQVEYAAKIIDVDKTKTGLEDLENVVTITGEYDNGIDEKTPVPEDADDTDTDTLNVYNPIVEIEKVDAAGDGDSDTGYWHSADDKITYHITVSNKGNTPLYQSVVTDTLSEELRKAVVAGSAKFDVGKEVKTALGKTANITVNGNTSITIDEIGVGDSVTVKFVVTVSDWETVKQLADTEGLKNKVTVTPGYKDPEDPTPADPDDSEVPVSIYKPLISVKKIADKTTVTDGGDKISGWYRYEDTVNYTITVSNDGNTDVFDLYVIDAIPQELAAALVKDSARFVIDGSGTVTTTKGNKVTIIQNSVKEVVLDKLAAGDSVTLEFTAEIADREAIKDVENLEELANMVKVIGTYDKDDEPTPVPEDEDDTDKEVINVYNPLMSVTKEADKENYDLGDIVTYKITVENYGNVPIYNIAVKDTLSKELKAAVRDGKASFAVSDRAVTENGETVTITKGDDLSIALSQLAAGDKVSVDVEVALIESAAGNTNLVNLENTVKITGEYGDPDNPTPVPEDEDDTAKEVISVYNPLMSVTKEAGKENYDLGDTVTYSVTVDNYGNTTIYNIVIKDTLSKELKAAIKDGKASFAVSDRVVTENGETVKITEGDDLSIVLSQLAAGDKVSVEVEITLIESAAGNTNLVNLENTVKIIGEYGDPDSPTPVPEDEDDTDKEVINVYNPLMSVTKEADKEYYDLGDTVTYNITVDNYGNVPIYHIGIVDTLSKELNALVKEGKAFFAVSDSAVTENGETVTITKSDDLSIVLSRLAAGDRVSVEVSVSLIDSTDSDTKLINLENAVKITGEYGDPGSRLPVPEDEDDEDTAIVNAYQGFVEIIKTSSGTKKKLKGAEFNIVNADNKVVGKLKTNSKGYAKSAALPSGKYYVVETKAPEGYVLNQSKHKFELEITKANQVVRLDISNEPLADTDSLKGETGQTSQPKTGDNTNIFIYIALAMASLGLITAYLIKKKKIRFMQKPAITRK